MTVADDLSAVVHAGGVRPAASPLDLDVIIAGAALTDLRAAGRIRTAAARPDGWSVVQVLDSTATGETVQDTMLEDLGDQPAVLSTVLGRSRSWYQWLRVDTADRGLLLTERAGRGRRTSWRTADGDHALELMGRMASCVAAQGATFDERALTLVRLLGSTPAVLWVAPEETTGLDPTELAALLTRLVGADAISAAVSAVLARRHRATEQAASAALLTAATAGVTAWS